MTLRRLEACRQSARRSDPSACLPRRRSPRRRPHNGARSGRGNSRCPGCFSSSSAQEDLADSRHLAGRELAFLTNSISSRTRCTSDAVRAGSHVQSIRTLYSGLGNFLHVRRRGDAVRPAEFLPDRVEQPRLQQQRHRPQRQPVRIVVLERPGQDDRDLALRRDALLDRLLDHAGRRRDAEVAPRSRARAWPAGWRCRFRPVA